MGIDTQHFASAQRSGMHATGFGDLVDDVLAEVARFLPRASDVLNFGLVVRPAPTFVCGMDGTDLGPPCWR